MLQDDRVVAELIGNLFRYQRHTEIGYATAATNEA